MTTLIRLPKEADCACLLTHHFRQADKAQDRSGGDASDARGATAIPDACRGTLTLEEMSESDAAKLRLPEGTTRHDYVRLDDARISRAKITWRSSRSSITLSETTGVPDRGRGGGLGARRRRQDRDGAYRRGDLFERRQELMWIKT